MQRAVPLRRAVAGCHLLLIGALAAGVVPPVTILRLAIAAVLAAPLLLTLRGLIEARRPTLQWLAVLLVPYIGGLSVEVVARSGDAPALSVALIAAVLELGLLLSLSRRSPPSAP
jgi:hypothetical protein